MPRPKPTMTRPMIMTANEDERALQIQTRQKRVVEGGLEHVVQKHGTKNQASIDRRNATETMRGDRGRNNNMSSKHSRIHSQMHTPHAAAKKHRQSSRQKSASSPQAICCFAAEGAPNEGAH